ncbi:MAG TPA: hypothetical protein DHV36_06340 [Desulfobacteraceae bacterium]|nr:hypothetical protein [Desulfobacteraceae bacterium]|tara:strand:+ start:132 stop:371 length:240 start_codon:yes stop_codon:yes gene_type:complete
MSNDAYFLEIMAKERQKEFENEARLRQLRSSQKKQGQGVWARLWIGAGNFLIRQGEAMKYRYAPRPCVAQGIPELNERE